MVVKGREAAAKIFADFVKPHDQGGLCGMKFSPEQTFVVGETLNIQWKAEADFLAEPVQRFRRLRDPRRADGRDGQYLQGQ